jgi:cell division protein FtsZ
MFNNNSIIPIVKIKVIGVGGAGNNAVNRMIDAGLQGVEFVAVNTDKQTLQVSRADTTIVIGEKLTKGFGAGANPEVGQRAAEESRPEIEAVLKDTDLIFITAGMGGGTGTGAAPIVAQIAREMGILTIAVVTKPFDFEGAHRRLNAEIGISNLAKFVDTTIIVPNQKLIEHLREKTTFIKAFEIADEVLRTGVQGLTDLIIKQMYINLDFADIDTVMRNSGIAHMGIGRARGEQRLLTAIRQAVSSPMLETSINGASKIIMSIKGGMDLDIHEVANSGNLIREVVDPGCNIIFGADIDTHFNEEVQIIIIATGFPKQGQVQQTAESLVRMQGSFGMLSKFNPEMQEQPKEEEKPQDPELPADDGTPPYLKKLRGEG